MGSGPQIVWMSAAPWIHLLPYLFLPPVVIAHLDCTYNSWTLLSCSWDADGNFTSSPCYISANVIDEKRDIKGFCFLTSRDNPRRCTIHLTSDDKPVKEILTVDHKLNLSVICSNGMKRNTSITFLSEFFAFHNLLLDPPMSTDIKVISYGLWQLTWDLNHRRNIGNTECEILYKPVNQLWQDAQNVRVKNVKLVILHSLHPDTQYEAKVRVKQTNFPGGRWSDWGKPVQWTTPPEGHLDCTHNSLDTVSCSWEVARNFSSTSCYLLAYVVNDSRHIKGICYLPRSSDRRSCVMNITVNGEHFSDAMTVAQFMNVSVICSVGKNINKTITSLSHFYPFINLRLDPPTSLDIRMIEDGTWNLSWVNTYRNYIDNVETEVHFKPVKWSWKDAKRFTITQCDLSSLLRDLYPGSLYEAKVRINQTNFPGGRWSDWSKPVQWTTPPKDILGSTFPTPGVVAIPVVLLIVVVVLCSSKRVKKVMWIGVPDPAHFFHPLIDTHKGNFKKWLSTPYVFSSFFLDPSPLDISPLNINCKVEEQSLKGPSTAEPEKDKLGHSSSSYTNQEYFSSVCLGYDHFPTTAVNESLHSPTDEEIPLFQAEYLCAPQSIAGFGVHNGSFERDASPQVIQNSVLAEEAIAKPQCDDEGGETFTHQETENVKEDKGKEIFEDHKESSDSFSTPMVYQQDGKPSMEANVAADYLSLKELYQKHCQWV
ncbi:interleukin-2 receptor subunit beta isoform X2 [Bufo bufo]|uniref:interleukin-2 receptor subunit beta isoform X2 n=1 Tax=Bufo bufo TaxID=8384 RepID=UPI001ABECC01|nr:interleukin-2 receptor subunit beta isoform X2 [Bufo bufo]